MSIDVPSTRRSRGSSDRMLIDEIQHHYPTQNLPQQVYSHCDPSFTTRPTVSPTMTCSRNPHFQRERTLASSALPPTSFSLQRISPSHDRGSPRGEANSASSQSLSLQHGRDKKNQVLSPITSPSRPCISQPPPSMIPSSLARPPGRSGFSPAAPPGTFSPKHGTPASRQGNGSPSTSPDAIIVYPLPAGVVFRRCVRQDSQPIALLSIDSRSACGTSPQSTQSLSPINEVWLPPMEKQLEMARKSQVKARFRKFKAIIGGAVNEIREVIVPYHKDHRKRKVARTNTNSEPFSEVPDYLRSLERCNPPQTTHTSRSQPRTSFDIRKDVDHITQTWTKLALCDSPTALRGDDVLLQGEVPHLSLSPPRINEPPMSKADHHLRDIMGDAANLAAPTFRRRRTADAFDSTDHTSTP
ncbi:hypothetical protein DFJ58DRAFT_730872 [Suillus subalutaceus]|uniref:uncharacterized protein n=1 Tax=Suillus subalutaceus TaxID=48586 RepID=UPI001B87F1CC|nr:uncharacterized protein DFJ58DRAFT_730872 [Suillus subalutaceus]KAG1845524.1 hypothetical protein DFJ58DRAFT_730872 [Suillus subalutaceus]